MVYQPGMMPTWLASQPSVPDLSCGFQFHFSLGTRSSTLRVPAISWSNSGSRDCAIDIIEPPKVVASAAERTIGEQKANCQGPITRRAGAGAERKSKRQPPHFQVECAHGT